MKKFFYFLLANAIMISSAVQNLTAQETTENLAHPSFQLLLSGGIGYANNKDMNDMAESLGKDQANQYNTLLFNAGKLQ